MIKTADARTLELFKRGRGDSRVARDGVLRRTGFEGYVGASTMNPDCHIRKQEKHKKHMIETVILQKKWPTTTIKPACLRTKSSLSRTLEQHGSSAWQHA